MQRNRWAALKSAEPAPSRPKCKLSADGQRAIIAAAKKRWAAIPVGDVKGAGKPMASKAIREETGYTENAAGVVEGGVQGGVPG
jgi:hypothetical protein